MVQGNPSEWSLPHRYGKYELLDRIGEGGMAEVYRARLLGAAGFEKIVVIKRILPHLARRPDFVRMFVNEAKLAAQIQHKNVVQVFELGQLENGELYIAMEFVQGIDLRGILRNAAERRYRIPIWFTLHTMSEVLAGLTHAHEFHDAQGQASPVIHRDVTPANVFISVNGEVKLADFGIAKAVGDSTGTEAGQVKGNVSYMSPEALLGEPLDSRADVFAAGVVLWELLTQHRLFQGRSNFETARAICDAKRDPPSRFNWKVTAELDNLCMLTLGPERHTRLSTAREFQARLLVLLSRVRPNLLPGHVKHVVEVILGRKPLDPRIDPELAGEMLAEQAAPLASVDLPVQPLGWLPPDLGAALDRALPVPVLDQPWPTGPIPLPPPLSPPPRPHKPIPTLSGATPPPAYKTIAGEKLPARSQGPSSGRSSQPSSPPSTRNSQPIATQDVPEPDIPLASLDEFMPWDPRSSTTDSLPPSGIETATASKSQKPAPATVFYIRFEDGNVIGPASYDELLKLCDYRAVAVSADRVRWQAVSTFARLSGLDRLARDDSPLRKVTLVGKLEDRNLVSVFAQLARSHATGKLVIMDTGANSSARREIDVAGGAPAYVYADHPNLQLPNLMVQQNLITKEQSAELVRQVLVRNQPLLDLISFQAFTDVNRVWPLLMRDRMVEVFKWRVGRLAFDAGAELKSATPFARSLHSVLFDSVYRGYTRDELARLLEGSMNKKLAKSEYAESVLREMGLSEKQAAIVERLQNKTLASLLKRYPSEAHQQMVLAFVLVEAEAMILED